MRRDVKIAFAWDGELSGLGLEAKERYLMEVGELAMMWHIRMVSSLKHEPTVTVMYGGDSLMELARFEHLTFAEQKIYMQNGGMALEVRPLSLSIFPEECVDRVSVEAAVINRRTHARHHCRIASPHSDVCLPRCLTTAGRRLLLLLLLLLMDDDDAAREDEPPGPQGLWKKIICGVIVVVLTLFPCLYLLLFGVQQGKAMLKVWWISSMTGFALTAVVYEPFAIFVQVPSSFLSDRVSEHRIISVACRNIGSCLSRVGTSEHACPRGRWPLFARRGRPAPQRERERERERGRGGRPARALPREPGVCVVDTSGRII